jgi:hypothetical protein
MHKDEAETTYVRKVRHGLVLNATTGITGPPSKVANHILSLFFKMVNNIEGVNPYRLPILLFDEPLTQHRYIASSFVFKPKHFPSINIIRNGHVLT